MHDPLDVGPRRPTCGRLVLLLLAVAVCWPAGRAYSARRPALAPTSRPTTAAGFWRSEKGMMAVYVVGSVEQEG